MQGVRGSNPLSSTSSPSVVFPGQEQKEQPPFEATMGLVQLRRSTSTCRPKASSQAGAWLLGSVRRWLGGKVTLAPDE
jgi:hypothetical protein